MQTLDNKIRSKNTHSGDTNTGFCCAIGSAEASEDYGGGAAHCAKEWLSKDVSNKLAQ